MKIEVNLERKYFFAILSVVIIFAAVIGVYAYGTSNPSVFGHSAGEIEGVGSVVTAANCNPITPNPTTYNQWTTICSVTTTKTSGTVIVSGSAVVERLVGLTNVHLRIRDSGNTIMAANTASDYADNAAVIKYHPLSVSLTDTLQGSPKTYYFEVSGFYTGQWFAVRSDIPQESAGAVVGASGMSNALWLKVAQ